MYCIYTLKQEEVCDVFDPADLSAAAARGEPAQFPIRSTIRHGKQDLLVVGLDNGNDALKGAVLAEDGRLVTIRIPTAFREALTIRGGKQEVAYTSSDTTFWVGDTALDHGGDGQRGWPRQLAMAFSARRNPVGRGWTDDVRRRGRHARTREVAHLFSETVSKSLGRFPEFRFAEAVLSWQRGVVVTTM